MWQIRRRFSLCVLDVLRLQDSFGLSLARGGYCVEVGRRANRNEYDSEALSWLPSTKIAVFASTV